MTTTESITVTGTGIVTPFATGTSAEVNEAIKASSPNPQTPWLVPDDFKDRYKELGTKLPGEIKREKAAWMTALAIKIAMQQANLNENDESNWNPERTGLIVNNVQAGPIGMIRFADEVRQQTPRFVSPLHFPQTVGNFVSGACARTFKIRGPNITIAQDDASAAQHALSEASGLLLADHADVFIVGGVDAWSETLAAGYASGSDESAPITESACFFVLQKQSDASQSVVDLDKDPNAAAFSVGGTSPSVNGFLNLAS